MQIIVALGLFIWTLRFLLTSAKMQLFSACIAAAAISLIGSSIIVQLLNGLLRSVGASGPAAGVVIALLILGAGYLGWWLRGRREDGSPFKPY